MLAVGIDGDQVRHPQAAGFFGGCQNGRSFAAIDRVLQQNDIQTLQIIAATVSAAVVDDHDGIMNRQGLQDNIPQGTCVIVDRYDDRNFLFINIHIF